MPDPPRYYWDSCVLLSFLNNHPERAPNIEVFLHEAEEGRIEIVTSIITLVEVAFTRTESDGPILTPAEELRIDGLWNDGSPVALVEFHPQIAREARALVRKAKEGGLGLKPLDAIHLATGIRMEVDEVHTYDEQWGGELASLLPSKVGPPLPEQIPLALEPGDEDA